MSVQISGIEQHRLHITHYIDGVILHSHMRRDAVPLKGWCGWTDFSTIAHVGIQKSSWLV